MTVTPPSRFSRPTSRTSSGAFRSYSNCRASSSNRGACCVVCASAAAAALARRNVNNKTNLTAHLQKKSCAGIGDALRT
jgi:hypothetical protein